MTGQEKLRRAIDTLNAMIQFDLAELQRKPLSADERLVIKNHLDTLFSRLQMLLPLIGGPGRKTPGSCGGGLTEQAGA
jgi:hypothetical protein